MSAPQLLNLSGLSTQLLGRPTYHFEEVDSTQDMLKKMSGGVQQGTVVFADHQHKGRGRNGHIWFSLPEPQIYFSVLLAPKLSPPKFPMINIAAGLAVIEALEVCGIKDPKIKWPNDVYIQQKKAAGILSELLTSDVKERPFIILGIGINVSANLEDFPNELRDRATALSLTGCTCDRLELLCKVLNALESWFLMLEHGNFKLIQSEFSKKWLFHEKQIVVNMDSNRSLQGKAMGIDEDGALLLQKSSSEIARVFSGEVTLQT